MKFGIKRVAIRKLRSQLAAYIRKVEDGRRFRIYSRGTEVAGLVPAADLKAMHCLVRMSDELFLRVMGDLLQGDSSKEDRLCCLYLIQWKDRFRCDEAKPIVDDDDDAEN